MKVKEFMTTNIESIDHKRSVYYAVERMVNRRIRCLLVRFSGNEREYGVITARDVVFKVLAKGIDPTKISVSKITSKPIVSIDQNMDFKEVAKIMDESDIARAFVYDQDRIIGLVALMDVMSATIIARARGEYVS
ncbi:MAG: CBS domain-containing protein [Deltaproteobacteria bacterium]|nr:CBS domain-containing protein [Deltaproteobacteria bacterium]MBW2621052.1 CBS domain-containing protein [Deltaproteobacteria bacterium]MBW2642429.1 CBS domain-containing protein [Deltaproteobacteria bacterium]